MMKSYVIAALNLIEMNSELLLTSALLIHILIIDKFNFIFFSSGNVSVRP